jgi:hypothetical protein
LLENSSHNELKESNYSIDDFIKNNELKDFYINKLNDNLINYDPGHPKHKPEVLNQIKKIQENRAQRIFEYQKNLEIEQCKEYYEKIIADKNYLIQELLKKVKLLTK